MPTTRESHFPVFQSSVTLAETPNWQSQQLRLWALNQMLLAITTIDTKICTDVGAHPAHHLYNTTVYVWLPHTRYRHYLYPDLCKKHLLRHYLTSLRMHFILYCITLHHLSYWIILYCIVLYYINLCCVALYQITLYHIVLQYSVLYYTKILYYTVLC